MGTVIQKIIPLALYIHFPWCVKKCPYCDFNSYQQRGEIPETAYVDALLRDLEQDLLRATGRPIHSIFMGGGTPSLFLPESMGRLLSEVDKRMSLVSGVEITLEANPGTVEQTRFQGYRAAGVNRLSIGVQSFSDIQLQQLGRIHGAKEAKNAVEAAKKAGFNNINIDLMFGLPHQTLALALEDLKQAVAFEPTHLSWYQLTREPNTLFYRHPPPLPTEDQVEEIYFEGLALLEQQGYKRYEVSAYARSGYECQHNRNYWEFGDYLGIGAGAHGKLTIEGQIRRLSKKKRPKTYLYRARAQIALFDHPHPNPPPSRGRGQDRRLYSRDLSSYPLPPCGGGLGWGVDKRQTQKPQSMTARSIETANFIETDEIINPLQLPLEFMMNALRLTNGFAWNIFESRTGLSRTTVLPQLQQAVEQGWIEYDAFHVQPTPKGILFLNSVLELFAE